MILRDRVTHCFQNTLHFLTKAATVISFIELTKFLWLLHDKSHCCVINSKVNNLFIRLSLLIKLHFYFYLQQDSSEEMYSLDNDSFLTSLEAMTIPTYWTETIKHTKL